MIKSIYIGDSRIYNFNFMDSDEVAINTTNLDLNFIVKENITDDLEDAILNIAAVHTDDSEGLLTITLNTTDTEELTERNYYYYFYITDAESNEDTLLSGSIAVMSRGRKSVGSKLDETIDVTIADENYIVDCGEGMIVNVSIVAFEAITGDPYDNTNLSEALTAKWDVPENDDTLLAIEEALTTVLKSAYDGAVSAAHSHSNILVLDGIDATDVSNWGTAYTNNHTHSNKATLDLIEQALTTALKSNYDSAYSASHSHSNITVLNSIQEALTTSLKSNYDSAYSHVSNTSNPHSVTASQIGLGSVENTALSTWAGTANILTVGTIGAGVWHGTAIDDTYISSAATWNAKVSSQWTSGSSLIYYNGKVGIGTITNPTEYIHTSGALAVMGGSAGYATHSLTGVADYYSKQLRLLSFGDGSDRGALQVYLSQASNGAAIIPFFIDKSGHIGIAGSSLAGGTTYNITYDLSFHGGAARTWGIERRVSADVAGLGITFYAGGCKSGSTTPNLAGGDIVWRTGIPSGNATSKIQWVVYGGGSSGTTDAPAVTGLQLEYNLLTLDAPLKLKAGLATAGFAPLYLQAGTDLTAAAAGAMEFDGTNLYFTPAAARKTIAFTDSNITGNAATVTGLYVKAGKTLSAYNTMRLEAVDAATLNIGTGGTLGTAAYTAATAYEVPLTFGSGLTRTVNAVANDLITGTAGGQSIIFDTAAGAATGYITSTTNATKGKYYLNAAGTIVIDEANARLGIGTAAPDYLADIRGGIVRIANTVGSNIKGGALYYDSGTGFFRISAYSWGAGGGAIPLILNYDGGNIGVGNLTPTARLHLPAGTATAGTAPFKIAAGIVNTAPEAGAIESDGTHLYWVDSGGTRRQLDN